MRTFLLPLVKFGKRQLYQFGFRPFICIKKFFPKFEIIRMRNTGVMDYWGKKLGGHVSRRPSSTCQSARRTRRGDETDVSVCLGCSHRDAATERIFLIIHNSRTFHPNNLKFWDNLLCTYMNNFPIGSFL